MGVICLREGIQSGFPHRLVANREALIIGKRSPGESKLLEGCLLWEHSNLHPGRTATYNRQGGAVGSVRGGELGDERMIPSRKHYRRPVSDQRHS